MTGFAPFRNLRSVMIVTIHVAVVAYVIRVLIRPESLLDSIFVAVPVTMAVALFLSWPISRLFALAFDPQDGSAERRCPRCGRRELRPLLRTKGGIFQPVTGYRCVGCWTTFRQVGTQRLVEPALERDAEVDPTGINFLDQEPSEVEVRFLDEKTDSSA
jgi:DNA-directed RNA polymerase subunit RPC12/RpoP